LKNFAKHRLRQYLFFHRPVPEQKKPRRTASILHPFESGAAIAKSAANLGEILLAIKNRTT
jgi:hypothetical protein